MTINGINGADTQMGQMGMNQAADSYSRNIQNQIANAQKQLQELSSNEDMTLEEKMKKRQEIQQQINDLNMQLRQHQMEQRKAAMSGSEKQQAKASSMDEMLGGTKNAGSAKAGSKGTGLSQAGMTAMISADSSIKQAKVQGSVATKMKGRAGVLESEIRLDEARGVDTTKKREELADVEQKAQAAAAEQVSALADAGKVMEEAAKADSREEPVENKNDKTDKNAENDDISAGEKAAKENVSSADGVNTQADISVSKRTQAVDSTVVQQPAGHTSIDIRL